MFQYLKKYIFFIFIGGVALASTPLISNDSVGGVNDRATSVREQLINKTPVERANIKGLEIAKIKTVARVPRKGFDIEIVDTNAIEGGVEVFARAWKDGVQVGFGDGTVEVERFRIFNPPILVPDEAGDVVKEYVLDQGEESEQRITRRFREDSEEALLQVIEHNLSVMKSAHTNGKIERGKIGRTTSTLYPVAGEGTAPMDATTQSDRVSSTWSTAHDDTTGTAFQSTYNSATDIQARIRRESTGSSWHSIYRGSQGFNTSVVGSDTISSATLSAYGLTTDNTISSSVAVDHHSPSSESTFDRTDYQNSVWDSVDQASRVAITSLSTSAYNDFALNATGIANINTSGNTFFGIRISHDIDDSEPSAGTNENAIFAWSSADTTGTTQDPKLVVEHSAGESEATTTPRSIRDGNSIWSGNSALQ